MSRRILLLGGVTEAHRLGELGLLHGQLAGVDERVELGGAVPALGAQVGLDLEHRGGQGRVGVEVGERIGHEASSPEGRSVSGSCA